MLLNVKEQLAPISHRQFKFSNFEAPLEQMWDDLIQTFDLAHSKNKTKRQIPIFLTDVSKTCKSLLQRVEVVVIIYIKTNN